jgi:hypothetical protein
VTTRCKQTGTAITAAAWIAVCAYLYVAWPSLAALLETLESPSVKVHWLIHLPRVVFPALGWLAVIGLTIKDRWLRAPLALVVDAVVGAPALLVLALLLHPFLVPVE